MLMEIVLSIRGSQGPFKNKTAMMAWWSRHAPGYSILQYYAPWCGTSFCVLSARNGRVIPVGKQW
jgi:hypothetical protein